MKRTRPDTDTYLYTKVDIEDKIIDNPVQLHQAGSTYRGVRREYDLKLPISHPQHFLFFFLFNFFVTIVLVSRALHGECESIAKKEKKRNKYHSIVFKRVLNLISVRLGCHCGAHKGWKKFFQYIFFDNCLENFGLDKNTIVICR